MRNSQSGTHGHDKEPWSWGRTPEEWLKFPSFSRIKLITLFRAFETELWHLRASVHLQHRWSPLLTMPSSSRTSALPCLLNFLVSNDQLQLPLLSSMVKLPPISEGFLSGLHCSLEVSHPARTTDCPPSFDGLSPLELGACSVWAHACKSYWGDCHQSLSWQQPTLTLLWLSSYGSNDSLIQEIARTSGLQPSLP